MIEPTPFERPRAERPTGNVLFRAAVALLVERRLPYQLRLFVDRMLIRFGRKLKKVRVDGFSVLVRRQTCDEDFVTNVILNNEYTCKGFEISATDTVIDIGGNIGTFTLVAARLAHCGRVYSFEPNEGNFNLLLRNLRLNSIANVVANRIAVSDRAKTVKLYTASAGGFHSVMEDRMADAENYELVEAIDLASVFDKYNIQRCHFLKMDCEGAEHEILHGLPAEYFARIDKIAMEFHGSADRDQRRQESDRLVRLLEVNGLHVTAYEEFDPDQFRGGFIFAKRGPSAP